jgi:predicted nucleic acid-binding protein
MAYKIFLDTNIIIDFFQKSRDLHQEAKELFLDIADGKILGYFSESVINTTAYILRNDLSKDDLIYQLDVLNSQLTILPCSNLIIHNAYKRAKNDLEDAVLYQLALENKLDYFTTSDINDFKKIASASLPIITSSELIKLIDDL